MSSFFVEEGVNTDSYLAEILDNSTPNNDYTANGHAIDDPALRIQNMVAFFADKIVLSGNDPSQNCGPLQLKKDQLAYVKVVNPVDDQIKLVGTTNLGDLKYSVFSVTGELMTEGMLTNENKSIPAKNLTKGVYILNLQSEVLQQSFKLIKK